MPATITLKGIWAALIAFAFVVVLALLVVQTIRLEGLKIWPVSIEGCLSKSERLAADLARVKQAQADALQKAIDAKVAAEQRYRNLAEKTDAEMEQVRSDAMDSAERYIAAHRVRAKTIGSAAGGSTSATGNSGAEGSNGAGEAPELDGVIVQAEDIRICTENTIRLESARNWALELVGGE